MIGSEKMNHFHYLLENKKKKKKSLISVDVDLTFGMSILLSSYYTCNEFLDMLTSSVGRASVSVAFKNHSLCLTLVAYHFGREACSEF